MNLTVIISDDGLTVTACEIHPVACSDVCQNIRDLVLRLHQELAPADVDGA